MYVHCWIFFLWHSFPVTFSNKRSMYTSAPHRTVRHVQPITNSDHFLFITHTLFLHSFFYTFLFSLGNTWMYSFWKKGFISHSMYSTPSLLLFKHCAGGNCFLFDMWRFDSFLSTFNFIINGLFISLCRWSNEP